MNWDDPAARAHLIDRVGPQEYNRQLEAHLAASVVSTVNGHKIRPVGSRFGRLFMVGKTGNAFHTLAEAETFAAKEPPADS
jgi:Fe-S cluster assembly scaffold protein SufB